MNLSEPEQSARDALRARQGKGARYDALDAPHEELLLARRGAAYFARKMSALTDDDLSAPSLREGWTRRHLIAHIGYHARAMAHLIETARTGIAQPMFLSNEEQRAQIDLGATLPARALRSLIYHAAIHLDVEWRDLADDRWDTTIVLPEDHHITARDTPRLRAQEVWLGAVDLGNGGRDSDIPPILSKLHSSQPFYCWTSP